MDPAEKRALFTILYSLAIVALIVIGANNV